MFIGVFILLWGVLMLLERSGVIEGGYGEFILPALIIAFGVSLIFDKKEKNSL